MLVKDSQYFLYMYRGLTSPKKPVYKTCSFIIYPNNYCHGYLGFLLRCCTQYKKYSYISKITNYIPLNRLDIDMGNHLKQLHAYDSKHELEQEGHQHNIVDSFHSYNHTLNNMLKIGSNAILLRITTQIYAKNNCIFVTVIISITVNDN